MRVAVYGPKDGLGETNKKPEVAYSIDVFIGSQKIEISDEDGKLTIRGQNHRLVVEPCFGNMIKVREVRR